ncbi:MAG: ABC transporter permease [Candidatus Scatomorpha sp.]|jgi:osmoprotectant transport system permease protein
MINLLQYIIEHLIIVIIATVISVGIGIILGIIGYWIRPLASPILLFSEAVQTIPTLALLAILMILFGLGNTTIISGLVLYALLPIVRNTHTGLVSVPPAIKEAARGMGMSKLQRLFWVELPLAFPLIFSGIKISVVNSLSIAVIGVLIGSGGLGYPIYRGIQTQNLNLIMSGAIPIMIMAILFDYLMSVIEKRLSRHAK